MESLGTWKVASGPGRLDTFLLYLVLINSNLNRHTCHWRRRQWQPTPVLLPGKSHGRRSLVGCTPWGHYESDTAERLNFHFSLSCIGEGNGNPLQCSCLEIPGTGKPRGLPSMGSHRVGHDWSDLAAAAAYCIGVFFSWLTSLCIIGSSFIHLIRTDSNVFFLMAE